MPIKALSGYWSNSTNVFKDIIWGQFFLYGNSHLWFLWVLFIVTIITWILKDNDAIRIILALIFFFGGCMIDIPQFGISKIFLNLIWFELGYLYGKNRNLIQRKIALKGQKVVFAAVSTIVYFAVLVFYVSWAKGSELAYGIVHLAGVVMSFSLSFLLVETKIKNRFWYRTILIHSMGIYLFSDSINYLILSVVKDVSGSKIVETNMGALLLFIFRICMTILVAILIDILIQKCKGKFKKCEV